MGFFDFLSKINPLLPIAGDVLGSVAGTIQADKNNKAMMQLAQYNWDQSIAQWNRENDYNKPINQMSRLREGGLNPNLVYGNGADTRAASSPSPQMPKLSAYTNFGDFGMSQASQSLRDTQRVEKEQAVADSQIEANKASANNQNAQALNHLDEHDVHGADYVKESMRHKIVEESNQATARTNQTINEANISGIQYKNAERMADQAFINLQKQGELLDADKIATVRKAALLSAEISESVARRSKIEYELSTNPDAETKKALNTELAEINNKMSEEHRRSKELENYITSKAKWGKVLYEWFPMLRGFSSVSYSISQHR